jgi:hypothetical protein
MLDVLKMRKIHPQWSRFTSPLWMGTRTSGKSLQCFVRLSPLILRSDIIDFKRDQ